jgi:hypothetical protein
VTVTFTVPEPAGLVVVIDVEDGTENVADAAPNFTDVAPVKFVPLSVTAVPPAVGPLTGLRLVTVGRGTNVN